jgi:hypothetical protein
MDGKGTGWQGVDWTALAQDRDMQRVFVNTVIDRLLNESTVREKHWVVYFSTRFVY